MNTSKTLRIAVRRCFGIASQVAMSADGIVLGTPAVIANEDDQAARVLPSKCQSTSQPPIK
ncbi:MAG: hypothetical protein R3E08_04495 [Thiotrichaceae bacterium]